MKHYPNDETDYRLYVLAEIQYERQCEAGKIPEEDRFPDGWYGSRDYHFKTEIIAHALKYRVTIRELPEVAEREKEDASLQDLCRELICSFGI